MTISEILTKSIIAFNERDYATGVKSCILQQCDLFENNVSQNNHRVVFAYGHQIGRHYGWLDAYQQFELGIQQAAMVHNCAVYVQQGSILVFFNKATYLRIM
jgi:hypothetical protein